MLEFRLRRDRIAVTLFSCKLIRCLGCECVELKVPVEDEDQGLKNGCEFETGGGKESKVNSSRDDQFEMNINQVSNYSYGEAEALTDDIEVAFNANTTQNYVGSRSFIQETQSLYSVRLTSQLVADTRMQIGDFALFLMRCSASTESENSDEPLVEGFEVIDIIFDVKHCLQGFVGMAKDLNAIVIAFRGTQERSLQNWIEDLYWKQLDLNYPGMPDAMVHHGFYFAYHNTTVRPGVVNAVKRAKQLYGDIDIMITGHSMGGAMAVFCGLDLKVNHEARNVQVMTFGQPRIGNAAFASYYSQLVPNTIRVTNDHDIVPHLPPYYPHFAQKTYHHFPREVWIHQIGFGTLVYKVEKVCDSSGEDPSCSRSVVGKSISDHLEYYGVEMSGESTCRIAMDPRVASYSTQDLEGNFILSRDPSASVVEMKIEPSIPSKFV